jgi:hypothetical protein
VRGVRRPWQSMGILQGREAVWLVTSSKDTARGHVALQVPPSPRGREVVVDHSTRPSARVHHPVIPDVDGHVIDPEAFTREHHQITGLKGGHVGGQGGTRTGLLARGARENHPIAAEDVLHEPGTVETGLWRVTPVPVAGPQVPLCRGEDVGRAASRSCASHASSGSVAGAPRCSS